MAKRPIDLIVEDEAKRNAAWLEDGELVESRADKKKKATQLERLGESLVKLTDAQLARVPMPDDLAAAVVEARRIVDSHGGYRRQVQFIGRIMRSLDAKPIAAALEAMKDEDAPSSASFRAAEVWRARLIAEGDAALEALVQDKPHADRTLLRQLLKKAVAKPPGRDLFRELKALFSTTA